MNTSRVISVLALALAAALVSGCGASKSEFDALQTRVYGLEGRSASQQRRIDELTAELDRFKQSEPVKANMWAEFQSVRAKVAEMEGQLAASGHGGGGVSAERLAQVEKDVASLKVAMQSQLGVTLGDSGAAVPAAGVAAGTAPAAGAMGGGATSGAMGGAAAGIAAGGAGAMAAGGAVPAKPAQPVGDPAKALYDKGYESFQKGDYAGAQGMFADFVAAYPKHTLTANAIFWQGESFFNQKDYPNAILKYEEVIKNYKGNDKYKPAMLKQGQAFISLGKNQAGRERLKQLATEFPSSPEGKRAKQILDGK